MITLRMYVTLALDKFDAAAAAGNRQEMVRVLEVLRETLLDTIRQVEKPT